MLCEMGQEADDADILEEVKTEYAALEERVEETRMTTLLSGEYDSSNAIMQFHAGAGGTEAQDWAQMLYRMYTRWAERHGFVYKILDYEDGDEAGIKSAAISIEGENAYGLLKSENGVHRLVRVSPFDANARRQTSFRRHRGHAGDRERRVHRDSGRGHRDAGLPGQRRGAST